MFDAGCPVSWYCGQFRRDASSMGAAGSCDGSEEIEGQEVPLGPGLAVTVEIKTGRRRVISFLLDPLLRTQNTALRER
jgi:hypothetical protein